MFDLEVFKQVLPVIEILAVIVFAASGALAASRKGLDLLGFMWLAVITGVGGGTVRDVILDVPVFWLNNTTHVAACLLTAVVVHFTASLVESRMRLLLWLDALGLALFTVAGTAKGLDHTGSALIAVVMGVITGSFGGIIRDVIGGEPSIILRREIYVTASALGAGFYWLLLKSGLTPTSAAIGGFLMIFTVRGLAIAYNVSMPVWRRSVSSRSYDDATKKSNND